jgi:hypothetical protein
MSTKEQTVKSIKNLIFGNLGGRFDRYYAGVLRPGTGYPTADEARKDMRSQDRVNANYIGWLR